MARDGSNDLTWLYGGFTMSPDAGSPAIVDPDAGKPDELADLKRQVAALRKVQQPPADAPVKLLTSWREITEALELRHDERDKVKSLNDRFNGPIPKPAKGGQPVVRKDVLIEWWNHLDALQQELQNRRDGERLTGESQYDYGRDGEVVPEIGGVKKRRRKPT